MKNLRFLFIGAVAGGGFGAQIGAYLSRLFETSTSALWIETGFIYGVISGAVVIATFRLAFAVAGYQSQLPNYDYKKMARA